jgi:tRNA(Ile)-lysidine synthetase-like protein
VGSGTRHPLLARLANQLAEEPLLSAKRLLLAVSGGLDSMVLLDALHHLARVPLLVAHVHHHTGRFSDLAAQLVRDRCAAHAIPLHLHDFHFNAGPGHNFEQSARAARYAFFQRLLQPGDLLLLAHHQGDQCESFFHLLLRGANPTTPLGMPARASQLLRPFLAVERSLLLSYATTMGVPHLEDPSNRDQHYLRNVLRHQVLPSLETFHAGFCGRLSSFVVQQNRLLSQLAQAAEALLPPIEPFTGLPRKIFDPDQPYLWPFLLDLFLKKVGNPYVPNKQREQVLRWLAGAGCGQLRVKGGVLHCDLDALALWPALEPAPCSLERGLAFPWGPLEIALDWHDESSAGLLHSAQSPHWIRPASLPGRVRDFYRLRRMPLRFRSLLPALQCEDRLIYWPELERWAEKGWISLRINPSLPGHV